MKMTKHGNNADHSACCHIVPFREYSDTINCRATCFSTLKSIIASLPASMSPHFCLTWGSRYQVENNK